MVMRWFAGSRVHSARLFSLRHGEPRISVRAASLVRPNRRLHPLAPLFWKRRG